MRAPGKELPALIHPDLETNECALRVVAAGQVKKVEWKCYTGMQREQVCSTSLRQPTNARRLTISNF
jgi:hypothetical protein